MTNLHQRLESLSHKIAQAKDIAQQKASWSDGHHLGQKELDARYKYLKWCLENKEHDMEAHGHRLSALEKDLIKWQQSLDLNASS